MDLCVLKQDGALGLHRHRPAGPEPFLQALAPDREDLGVCGACLFTWDWLADLGTPAGMPCVLGHALDLKAIPGGNAQHEKLEAHNIAVLRRGGLRPQASVYPAAMRATRALRRRRLSRMRPRAARLTHVQQTTRPDHGPASGQNIADTANRDGGADRFPEPAIPQSSAVALPRRGYDAGLLTARELGLVHTAKAHQAPVVSRRRSLPGGGQLRALVLRDDMHAIQRVPRVQALLASGRRVTWATASAGQRYGTSGRKLGQASLQGACADAAVWFLRHKPAGQTSLARFERPQGQGTAWTLLAPH